MSSLQKTWDNYHRFALQRGKLVTAIIAQFTIIKDKNILDIGCGDGGTSFKFAHFGALVTAVDIRPELVDRFKNSSIKFFHGSIENFSLTRKKFDIIILQDVLEHVPNPETTINKIKSLLSQTGIIYISTPNRLSIINLVSDPHWNFPCISLFSRRWVKLFIKTIFRKDRRKRKDWAALLSLFKLRKLLSRNKLEMSFVNSIVCKNLFEEPETVVCRPSHLKLINLMKQLNLKKLVLKIVNDKFGIFNYFINPTWYIIGKLK
jgi:2-polyprenyl-3-methyl-5-hydroxy-6-metoxy-1,4-benzoquinol methylase